jgi:hypothetical protein
MCMKHTGTNLWSHEKGSNYSSCTPITPPHTNLSCNGISWRKMRLSADQYPLRWNQTSPLKRKLYGLFLHHTPCERRSFFTNYVVLFVNQAELCGRKCSSFVAIRADRAHMPVCCTSRTNDLLGDASNLSPISCSFPQHLFCTQSYCPEVNLCSKPFRVFVNCCLVRKPRIRHARPDLRLFLQKLFSTHRTENVLSCNRIRSIDCR